MLRVQRRKKMLRKGACNTYFIVIELSWYWIFSTSKCKFFGAQVIFIALASSSINLLRNFSRKIFTSCLHNSLNVISNNKIRERERNLSLVTLSLFSFETFFSERRKKGLFTLQTAPRSSFKAFHDTLLDTFVMLLTLFGTHHAVKEMKSQILNFSKLFQAVQNTPKLSLPYCI